MKMMSAIAVAVSMFAVLMLGSTESLAQGACESSGNHTIQVRAGSDGNPVLSYNGGSAEEVNVCIGDTVRWVLTGSDREYLVNFFAGAPFAGAEEVDSNGGVVSVVIGGSAERGKGYDYDVKFVGGGNLDPRIVVN